MARIAEAMARLWLEQNVLTAGWRLISLDGEVDGAFMRLVDKDARRIGLRHVETKAYVPLYIDESVMERLYTAPEAFKDALASAVRTAIGDHL